MANHGQITIVKATPEHSDQVLRLLEESFSPREPLTSSIGIKWSSGFGSKIKDCVAEGYSFVALDPSGRVVGCRISTIRKIERNLDPEPDFIAMREDNEKSKLLKSIFQSLMAGWTKELLDCQVVLDFVLMCVEEKYGGKGIAAKLVNRSLELAKELGVDYVYAIATNWKSQRVFDKLNFTTMRTKNYDEFVDENGQPRLEMNDGSTCVKWMVKKIKV